MKTATVQAMMLDLVIFGKVSICVSDLGGVKQLLFHLRTDLRFNQFPVRKMTNCVTQR